MSAKAVLADLDFELVLEDGVPMDKPSHRRRMNLFLHLVDVRMLELGRPDFFAGGDMFVYYSHEQARPPRAAVPRRGSPSTDRAPSCPQKQKVGRRPLLQDPTVAVAGNDSTSETGPATHRGL